MNGLFIIVFVAGGMCFGARRADAAQHGAGGAALSQALQMAGLNDISEVAAPKIPLSGIVAVPEGASAQNEQSEALLRPLIDHVKEMDALNEQLIQALAPLKNVNCDSWWTQCRGPMEDVVEVFKRMQAAKKRMKQHTERLFLQNEIKLMSDEHKKIAQAYYKLLVMPYRDGSTNLNMGAFSKHASLMNQFSQIEDRLQGIDFLNQDMMKILAIHYGKEWVESARSQTPLALQP